MNTTDTVKDLLLLAMSAEESAQAFYAELSRMFRHMPDVSARWKEMMNDEVQHKNSLEKIFAELSEEELCAPAPDIIQKLRATLCNISLKDKLSSVKTLDDAYEIAFWLEHSEVNIAFKVMWSRPITATSFQNNDLVVDMISKHVAKLNGFGNKEWRQEIKAEK